jgi:hypothetical protein
VGGEVVGGEVVGGGVVGGGVVGGVAVGLPVAAVSWIAHGLAVCAVLPNRNMLSMPDETKDNPAKAPKAG